MTYGHPQDTAASVRLLCNAHQQLREIYFQEMPAGQPDIFVGPKENSPNKRAAADLTCTISNLLATLPQMERLELLPEILFTHEASLIEQVPKPVADYRLVRDQWSIRMLIPMGADAFRLELDYGLTPPLQELNYIFEALMEKLRATQGPDDPWYDNCRRYLMRAHVAVIGSILDYVHSSGGIPADLSVFLSELLQAHVKTDPASARKLCEGSMFASCTFKISALILAGLTPPPYDEEIYPKSAEVNALVNQCRSQHGRLDFIARHGPLHCHLERATAPDLASST